MDQNLNSVCCRCLDLQGLNDEEVKHCVTAAAFRLEYPGTLKPEAAVTAAAGTAFTSIADAAALLQSAAATLQEAAAAAATTSKGAEAVDVWSVVRARRTIDAYERLQCQQSRSFLLKTLLCASAGGTSLVEQVVVAAVAVGIACCVFTKLHR